MPPIGERTIHPGGQTMAKSLHDKLALRQASFPLTAVTAAIYDVLDYLFEDEQRDYLGLDPDERTHHIFHSLVVLQSWISSCDVNMLLW